MSDYLQCVSLKSYMSDSLQCVSLKSYMSDYLQCVSLKSYMSDYLQCVSLKSYMSDYLQCVSLKSYMSDYLQCVWFVFHHNILVNAILLLKLSYIIIWVSDQRAISEIIVHHYLSEWSESDHWNYRTSLFEWVISEIIVHHYLSEWSESDQWTILLSYIINWVSDQRAISERYYSA
jgi:hypothetical protein